MEQEFGSSRLYLLWPSDISLIQSFEKTIFWLLLLYTGQVFQLLLLLVLLIFKTHISIINFKSHQKVVLCKVCELWPMSPQEFLLFSAMRVFLSWAHTSGSVHSQDDQCKISLLKLYLLHFANFQYFIMQRGDSQQWIGHLQSHSSHIFTWRVTWRAD